MRALSWVGVVVPAGELDLLLAEKSDTYTVYRSAASGDGVTGPRGAEASAGTISGRVDPLKAWEVARAAEAGVQVGTHVFLGRRGQSTTLQRGDRLLDGDGNAFRVVTVGDFDWKVEARLTEVN